jgi:hypothetical protein
MTKEERRQYQKKYQQSPKGKEAKKKYCQSSKGKESGKRSNRQYYQSHKEERAQYSREYHQSPEGKKVGKKARKKYYQSPKGKETRRKYQKKYQQSPRGQKTKRRYNQSPKGKETRRQYQKKYYQSSEGKKHIRIYHAKRKQFGFIPLNEPFEGCEGHHIDFQRVIYIPKELHRSIWHSVILGVNMKEINEIAFDYLKMGNKAGIGFTTYKQIRKIDDSLRPRIEEDSKYDGEPIQSDLYKHD